MHNCALQMQMANILDSHIQTYVIELKLLLKGLHISNVNEDDLRFSAWSRYMYHVPLYHQTLKNRFERNSIFSLFCPIRSTEKKIYFRKISFFGWLQIQGDIFLLFPRKTIDWIERLSIFNANQSKFGADSHFWVKKLNGLFYHGYREYENKTYSAPPAE